MEPLFLLAAVAKPHFSSPLFTEFAAAPPSRETERLSPEITAGLFERAVLSWNATGDWQFLLRVRIGERWSSWQDMGGQQGERLISATLSPSPRPVTDDLVGVDVDTLLISGGKKAGALQVRALGTGELRSVGVAHYRPDDNRFTDKPAVRGAWGVALPVPGRAQRDVEEKQLGGIVCSPTSLAMVLDYYGKPLRTIDVCRAAYDATAQIYGNWAANAAAAARLLNGWAAVVKMRGWDEVEREIAQKRPVILSHRWEKGQLTNAPISRSTGHLIVIVGFTENGDVVVNDPAAKSGEVRRVYRRAELFATWQKGGAGIVYVMQPA